ncbi:MAG: hypothetical protein JRC90_09845 [Deltaproteobacteria bacterium]|nr:hypothetical protein [Deltaproteobacteria bacterium]
MAYCTTDDVYLEAGTATGTAVEADIINMIIRSDEEITSKLRAVGIIDLPESDIDLKTASIQFTIAKIKRRQAEELSRPGSLKLGNDIAFTVNPEAESKAAEAKGYAALDLYANYAGGSGVVIVPNADDPYLELR